MYDYGSIASVHYGCSHEPEYVMDIDGVLYHGADKQGARDFIGNLMINFTDTPDTPSVCSIPELAKHVPIGFDQEIMINWPDFGIPVVNHSFWEALHEYIKGKKWDMICFHCQAGHGRTGTALAAMLVSTMGYTPTEAVEHVREYYCEEAVESKSQCDYLKELDKYYNEREDENENLVPSYTLRAAKRQSVGAGSYGAGMYGGGATYYPYGKSNVIQRDEDDEVRQPAATPATTTAKTQSVPLANGGGCILKTVEEVDPDEEMYEGFSGVSADRWINRK